MKIPLLFLLLLSNSLFAQVEQVWIDHQEGGYYNFPYGMELNQSGSIYVMYYQQYSWYASNVVRINEYNSSGDILHTTLVDSGGLMSNGLLRGFRLTSDNHFILTGHLGPKVIIAKCDNQGNMIWEGSVTAGGFFYLLDVILDQHDNTYLLIHNTTDTSVSQVARVSSNGISEWIATYDPGVKKAIYPKAMTLDEEGNVYVTGVLSHYDSTFYQNAVTLKYDSLGTLQWVKEELTPDQNVGAITQKDGYVFVFATHIDDSSNYFMVYCYDINGNSVWLQQYTPSVPSVCLPERIMHDMNGNIIAIGEFGNTFIVALQYSASGFLNWSDEFSDIGNPHLNEADVDEDGDIVIAGIKWSNEENFWLRKYDVHGTLLWDTTYDSNPGIDSEDIIYFVQFDPDGNVMVCGTTNLDIENGSIEGLMTTTAKYADAHTSLEEDPGNCVSHDFKVQPNPVSDLLFFGENTDVSDFFITDASGQKLSCQMAGKNAIDVHHLPPGIYFLHSKKFHRAATFIKQ